MKHINIRFKPYDWQKYGHKYGMEDVSEYRIENGLFMAKQPHREVIFPLANIEIISIFNQADYQEGGDD